MEADTRIRLLLLGTAHDVASACIEAEARMHRTEADHRPRAQLQARILYSACLYAAAREREALEAVAPAVELCAELGLPRFLLDGGPDVAALIGRFAADKKRNAKAWPTVPLLFIDEVLQLSLSQHPGGLPPQE